MICYERFNLIKSIVFFTIIVCGALVCAYPTAAALEHGLNPSIWPVEVISPYNWFMDCGNLSASVVLRAYWEMVTAQSAAFSAGGRYQTLVFVIPSAVAIGLLFFGKPKEQEREASGIHGDAKFASLATRARMRDGLELGLDPETGKAVRVKVEGTLITFAPPRTGKTSGLLIPNLAFPEVRSWAGPAVVLDTKGDVYRATSDRRRALGRKVVCLDPLNLVNGRDRWNPLAGLSPSDILYLQRAVSALLPMASDKGADAYFHSRAVDLLTGTFLAALRAKKPTPGTVLRLLNNTSILIEQLKALGDVSAAKTALAILQSEERVSEPIVSTAAQAFQWLQDERLDDLTCENTFDLAELASGDVDLFVAIPSDSKKILAPFLRWFLSDLFAVARRLTIEDRIVVFVDEAANLGRFDDFLSAASELPGRGISLWTYWQDRSQIVSLYGKEGADSLINLAEVVTVSDISAVDPDERERWSKAIGVYTAMVESDSTDATGKSSTSKTRQAVRLMSPDALNAMKPNELLVLMNSRSYARDPLRLHKTVSHEDRRFRRFLRNVQPVKAS